LPKWLLQWQETSQLQRRTQKDVDKWNGNLKSTLGFTRESRLRQAGLDANCFGNTVLLLQLLFISFVDLKSQPYIRNCDPGWPKIPGPAGI